MNKRRFVKFYILLIGLFFATNTYAQKIPTFPEMGSDLPTYLKWVFDAGMAIGFISVVIGIVISGIYFILSPVSVEMRSKAKEWLTGTISGLLIFLLLYLILTTVNPELAIFKIGKPIDNSVQAPPKNEPEGVYFYEKTGCDGDPISATASGSFSDARKLLSIKVVNSVKSFFKRGGLYFAIAYDKENYQGKCEFFTQGCFDISLTDVYSAYVGQYDALSNGSVTFYRNPGFEEKGGYKEIGANFIDKELKDTYFGDSADSDSCTVPKDEQDCKEWDEKGVCIKKECPNLEGKNIGSIKINGKAIVLLSYRGPTDTASIQTFCQTYPSIGNNSLTGPKQTQWDNINNLYQYPLLYYPNHVRVMGVLD